MKNHLTKNWLMWCLFTGLLAGGLSQTGLALTCSCSVGPEQNILFHLRGVATMAGSVTVRISHGDTNQTPPTILSMVGGAIVLDPQGSGTYVVDHYDCVQWAQDIPVQLKPGEPVLVEYIYEHDNRLPTYTEFKYQEGNPNPVVWFTQPSLPCLQVYEDAADENWIPEIPVFMTYNDRLRLMGLIATDDSSIGISPMGVSTEGGQPIPDNPELQNSKPIGDLCGAGGAAAQALSSSGSTTSSKAGVTPLLKNHRPTAAAGARAMPSQLNFGLGGTNAMNGEPSKARKSQKLASIERELGIKQSRGSLPEQAILKVNPQPLHFKPAATPGAKTKTSKTNNKPLSQGTANLSNSTLSPLAVQSGGQVTNGYTVAQRIGQLRWEMSLGSLGRKVTMGRLVYQANSLDATAYSPERLSLNLGSRTSLVTRDTNGYLRQVKVGASLVDIPATNGGFQVAVYPLSQVGPADPQTGFLTVSGAPTVSWNVVNPDPAPQGRIVFTRTAGTNSEVHEAQWQGVSGAAGTMTISRFGGKWTEVRDYSLAATNTQRIETISQYKNNVLQHKSREVYQQFYNWGNPGDIYEALVQRVEDPDGKALASSYIYWDQTTQGGNEIYAATYPDGYSEIIPSRVTGDAWPVVAKGGILELDQPFQDYDPGSANSRVTRTTYNVVSDTQITETTSTMLGGQQVGYHTVNHVFPDVYWVKQIVDYTGDNSGTWDTAYEERWVDLSTMRPVFNLDRNGKTETFSYEGGYWLTDNATFSSYSSSGQVAMRTTIVHGSDVHKSGVANKTTVDVTVEDQYGHIVLEESYVGDGQGGKRGLIDRKIHTYTDGRLTATSQNGRLVYQAGYDSEGYILWEEDESGRHTDYVLDELKRVSQKIIRGRGGDADKMISYDYDVLGHKLSETVAAGGLTVQSQWNYDVAGELASTIAVDGLTNFVANSYTSGHKVSTETLPTLATRATSYFRDRQMRSVIGTAVEPAYYAPRIVVLGSAYREGQWIYHDSALTQLKQIRLVNWIGDEILLETLQFQGAGYRNRFTYYGTTPDGYKSQLPVIFTETGRATQLSIYDEFGQLTAQGVDLDNSGTLDAASLDQMTVYDQCFTNDFGPWQQLSTVQRYLQDNLAAPTLVQRTRTTVPAMLSNGMTASNVLERVGGGIVISTTVLDPGTGTYTSTVNDAELGQIRTRVERDGLLRSETKPGISSPWTYLYTGLGESQIISDPLSGSVTNVYDSATRRLLSVTDGLNRQTTYDYYPAGIANAGRVRGIQDPNGKWTYFDYTAAGQVFRQWGVNTYPIQQMFDEQGRMTNLVTFRTSGNTVNWASTTWPDPLPGDSTQWLYDQPSGLLAKKLYADNKGLSYGYNSANFLNTKTNGRNQTITYGVDTAGLLRNVTYSDNTPSVSVDYDRAGRQRTVTDAAGTRTVTWTDRDQMGIETYTTGLLAGVAVTRGYDVQFRQQTLGVTLAGMPTLRQRFAYDSISWLDYITDETPDGATVLHKFDYTFKPGTPFVQSIDFYRGSTPIMTQNYTRDSLGRLSGAGATFIGGGSIGGVNYQFDALNRRYEADLVDGTKWSYGYDDRSEVTSGKRHLASGVYAGGEQYEYGFDDIGNRTVARFGGDGAGSNLRESDYGTANSLNQLTTRTVPGFVWVVGDAQTNLALQAVGQGLTFPVQRQDGQRFFGEGTLSNSLSANFARITIIGKTNGVLSDVETGHQFIPQNPESFTHDDDGNLTRDGRWTYTWDAGNRLSSVTARVDIPDAAKQKVDFLYDVMGRRIQKIVSGWNGSGYVAQSTNLFLYDGWNLVAKLDGQGFLVQSFNWGPDLSGTMQGAGGVGGLLAATVSNGTNAGDYYYTFDGNGNVQTVVNSADGGVAANYEYGPFGEVIRTTGPMARANSFRFATKFMDNETDLLYYGYRYYNPSPGRWLSRDPMEESGSTSLYCFVNNRCIDAVDFLGLYGPGGHYWTALFVALASGVAQPGILAYFAQLPDQDPNYTATETVYPWNNLPFTPGFSRALEVQNYVHSLHGGDVRKRQEILKCLLKSGNLTPEEMGIVIHAFGDAYAHTFTIRRSVQSPKGAEQSQPLGTYSFGRPIGHLLSGHLPDVIRHNTSAYREYTTALFDALNTGDGDAQALNTYLSNFGRNTQIGNTPVAEGDFIRGLINNQFPAWVAAPENQAFINYRPEEGSWGKIESLYPNGTDGIYESALRKIKDAVVHGCCLGLPQSPLD